MELDRLFRHRAKVAAIAALVRGHAASPRHGYFSLSKASVPHTVPLRKSSRRADRKLPVTALTDVVSVDPVARLCEAESGVTFEDLVRATLPHGLVPKTVPELRGITTGGAVAGCSVESMSYRYGGFHDSCVAYEVVTGTGDVVRCSRDETPELFHMVHGSFGTVGILTLLRFELVPAEPFVRMEYVTHGSFTALLDGARGHYERQDVDFMDAVVHAPDRAVLCLGSFVKEAPYANAYRRTPYYRSTAERRADYLKTEDYLFRFDADCHWVTRNFGLENPLLRRLLGPVALGSTNILRWANRVPFLAQPRTRPDVVADVFIPFSRAAEFFDWYQRTFDYFPLWVVPYRMAEAYPWINPELLAGIDDELFIDCAIYGFRQRGRLDYYRALEEKVFELHGVKTLITHNAYPEQEFWRTFNRPRYQAVKSAMDPHNLFRDLYGKTHAHATRPVSSTGV